MPNRRPIDITATRKAIRRGEPVFFPDLDVTHCTIHGRSFAFASDRMRDPIQRSHRAGTFYEEPELAMIRAHFPQGGTFVDIGANVGNHSLYVAAFLQPARVVPVEPNPIAGKLLLANIALNNLAAVTDLRLIGMGLSDAAQQDFAMTPRDENLGGAQMVAGEGAIETQRGDDALARYAPDFIKIDVEGMEMQVLTGLEETIARHAPVMLIEVDKSHDTAFHDWCAARGYVLENQLKRYNPNTNYLIRKPPDRAADVAA